MKVRLAGFNFQCHPKLTIDALYAEMVKQAGARFKFQSHARVLQVASVGDHVLGSLLTDRGHKNFLAIHTETNVLSPGTLGPKKNFGAFNFFVLCRKSKTALLTCYKDAGGPSFVFGCLERIGDELVRASLKKEIAALGPEIGRAHV